MLHNVLPQIFYSGGWHFIAADILTDSKIMTTRGVTDDGEIRPCKITWTFNNQADNYRPSNPAGPLYGLLQRNMPAAVAADLSVRACAEAVSYSPDQSPEFNAATGIGLRWVDMVGMGVLDRITGWDEPLRSPMYRQINRYTTLRAYLPLEDGRNTEVPLNAAPGGGPGFGLGVTFGSAAGPDGAGTATAMSATSRLGVPVSSMSSTAGYQVFFTVLLDAVATAVTYPLIAWTLANGDFVSWDVNNGSFHLKVIKQDGTLLADDFYLFGTGGEPWTDWETIRIKVAQSGGNVSVDVSWYPQNGSFVYSINKLYAGSVSRPTNVRIYGNPNIDGALYNHVGVLAGVTDNLTSYDFQSAFNGYRGELAGDRFNRLMSQVGEGHGVIGNTADTWPMGPQKPDTLINLLKEIKNTEDGLIFDTKGALGVTMRTRMNMTNQAAALTLAYLTDIAPLLKERIDTADIANEVTVSQRDGGSATVSLTVGALSNQAPPNGIGTKKGTQDVNVSDETALPVIAGWHLSRRTADGSRYDTVVIDTDGDPALITAVNAVEAGDRIVITGREPEPIELIVYGILDSIETARRLVTFTCVPGAVYQAAIYSSANSRYDVDASTVGVAVNTTATAWTVTAATIDDTWAVTGAGTPYEWLVTGERVRVTAMNAPTGTGPYSQPCTVVRSVNGVVKSHAIGDQVHMAPRTDSTPGSARYTIGRV
jgi:hypothetical protein